MNVDVTLIYKNYKHLGIYCKVCRNNRRDEINCCETIKKICLIGQFSGIDRLLSKYPHSLKTHQNHSYAPAPPDIFFNAFHLSLCILDHHLAITITITNATTTAVTMPPLPSSPPSPPPPLPKSSLPRHHHYHFVILVLFLFCGMEIFLLLFYLTDRKRLINEIQVTKLHTTEF